VINFISNNIVLIGYVVFALFLLVRFVMYKRGLLKGDVRHESDSLKAHEAAQNMIRDDIENSIVQPGTGLDYYHLVDNGLDNNKHNV